MSAIIFLAPTIGWTWPALIPLITAVAAGHGYKRCGDPDGWLRGRLTRELENLKRVNIPIEISTAEVVAEELGNDERLAFEMEEEGEKLLLVFRKDMRGKLFVEVSGRKTVATPVMQLRGEEFAGEVIKKFAYHRLIEQIERHGSTVVDEQVDGAEQIKLKVRQWR